MQSPYGADGGQPARACSMALAILVRFWLLRVRLKASQMVRAASRRVRGSVQSAGAKDWPGLWPRVEGVKEPSSASEGVMWMSLVPTRTEVLVMGGSFGGMV